MNAIVETMTAEPIAADRTALDWRRIGEDLDAHGCAVIRGVLSGNECASLSQSYREDRLFRSRIVMARHGFGRGEYKYFAYPLPKVVAALRTALYPPLAEIAKDRKSTRLNSSH